MVMKISRSRRTPKAACGSTLRLSRRSHKTQKNRQESAHVAATWSVLQQVIAIEWRRILLCSWTGSRECSRIQHFPTGSRLGQLVTQFTNIKKVQSSLAAAGGSRGGVAEPISQSAHLGIGCGPVSVDVEHSRDPPESGGPVRNLVRYRMRTPDPALPEDAQSIDQLAHILRNVLLHRKGIEQEGPAPPTNNERKIQSQLEHRRKRAEGNYT